MQDRVSLHPGRVKLVPVAGQENTYDMVRADSPTQEGTPLNKDSLLKDATAALYGFENTAVLDDIFKALSKAVLNIDNKFVDVNGNALIVPRIEYGSYVGTGATGAGASQLVFTGKPYIVVIWLDSSVSKSLGVFFPFFLTSSYLRCGYLVQYDGSTFGRSDAYYAKYNNKTNTLSFYYKSSQSLVEDAGSQFNTSGSTYKYAGLIV